MGIVWETDHKGVPLLVVPENSTDKTHHSKAHLCEKRGSRYENHFLARSFRAWGSQRKHVLGTHMS